MPRRGFVPKREVLPDPVYGNTIVTKLINQTLLDGKRGIAQSVCYDAFQMLADKTGKDAMEVFNAGLQNILPSLEVKARRVGGATYQVPIEIQPGAPSDPGPALAGRVLPQARREDHGRAPVRRDHRRRATTPARLSSVRKKCTVWPRPTRRSLTIAGNFRPIVRGAAQAAA